ncbi:MAG TPA: hypothetical protein VLA04_04310 [Verrucomicrobiae bacterium]|nr:hypothetical protein [Verrucomicrobiae bacterium]
MNVPIPVFVAICLVAVAGVAFAGAVISGRFLNDHWRMITPCSPIDSTTIRLALVHAGLWHLADEPTALVNRSIYYKGGLCIVDTLSQRAEEQLKGCTRGIAIVAKDPGTSLLNFSEKMEGHATGDLLFDPDPEMKENYLAVWVCPEINFFVVFSRHAIKMKNGRR